MSLKVADQILPVLHYALAALFFLFTCILILFSIEAFSGHYFHPKLLATTHLAVLGWGVMQIFAAIYQFLPKISGNQLFSVKMAHATTVLLASGTLLLAYSFWNFKIGLELQVAGILVFLAFLAFAINIVFTLKEAEKNNIAADFVQSASFWLIITGVLGLLMVFNFRFPFLQESHLIYLKVHAHAGFIGWFLLLIIGFGSTFLKPVPGGAGGVLMNYVYWSINIGLILYIFNSLVSQNRINYISIILIFSGIGCFSYLILKQIRSSTSSFFELIKRLNFTFLICLMMPLLILLMLVFEIYTSEKMQLRLNIAYGTSIIMGTVTVFLLYYTFKLLPHLVWRIEKSIKDKNFKLKLKNFNFNKIRKLTWNLYFPGVILFITGLLLNVPAVLYIAGALLVLAALVYGFNLVKILIYILRIVFFNMVNKDEKMFQAAKETEDILHYSRFNI